MDISCAFAPAVDTPDHIAAAERLGYARAWCYDGPTIWGDVWMTLGQAARLTSRIGLGTAVLVPGYRDVLVNASAIASLEALAPGRVTAAVGAGHGQRMAGRQATRWSEVVDYVENLRLLLSGKEAEIAGGLATMMHSPGFVADRPIDVPVLIAAEGPKGVEIAHRVGDGLFSVVKPKAGFDWSAVLVWGTVLPADGPADPAQVMAAAGPGAAILYHFMYELGPAAVDQLPGGSAWRAMLDAVPAERRHLAAWHQHLVGLTDIDRAVLTPEIVQALTLTGTPAELRDRLSAMEAAGATEIVYQPAGPDIEGELSRFARMAGLPAA